MFNLVENLCLSCVKVLSLVVKPVLKLVVINKLNAHKNTYPHLMNSLTHYLEVRLPTGFQAVKQSLYTLSTGPIKTIYLKER